MKSRTKLKNAKPKPLRVVLADASLMCKLLADALETQSQFRVVGCAVDGNELLNTLAEVKPDVALIGVHLQNGYQSGISSLQAAHGRHPSTPLILLIDRTEPQTVVEAFRAGAKGVFSRSQPEVGVLAKCIQRVIEGQIWVDNTQLLSSQRVRWKPVGKPAITTSFLAVNADSPERNRLFAWWSRAWEIERSARRCTSAHIPSRITLSRSSKS